MLFSHFQRTSHKNLDQQPQNGNQKSHGQKNQACDTSEKGAYHADALLHDLVFIQGFSVQKSSIAALDPGIAAYA